MTEHTQQSAEEGFMDWLPVVTLPLELEVVTTGVGEVVTGGGGVEPPEVVGVGTAVGTGQEPTPRQGKKQETPPKQQGHKQQSSLMIILIKPISIFGHRQRKDRQKTNPKILRLIFNKKLSLSLFSPKEKLQRANP